MERHMARDILKTCPFCGQSPTLAEIWGGCVKPKALIYCLGGCEIEMSVEIGWNAPEKMREDMENAKGLVRSRWNRRAT